MIERPHNQGINRPHACRTERKQIANRRKLQNKLSIQHNKHHANKRNHTPENLSLAKAFALVNEPAKNHRQKWIRADNQRDIARWRNRERRILRPKVKRATREPAQAQNQFVLPVFTTELFMRHREQQQVRHRKAQRENLHRRKTVIQKHLRAHKTRAPKRNRSNRKGVPKSETVTGRFHHHQR